MAKLKIGLVLDDSLDKPNGVQQYVLIIGRWLAAQGHDVRYLVGQTERTDVPNMYSLAKNMSVRFNQNRMTMPLPVSVNAIRKVLDREQFDVLHVQVPYSPFLAGRIIKAAGSRTAVTGLFHILPYSKTVTAANYALGAWVRLQGSLQRFDTLFATSEPAAAFAQRTLRTEVGVVPLPVELDKFRGAKPLAQYKDGRTVMFLGRLVERKGCQHLLHAVAHAVHNDRWPKDTRVVICSDGHLRPALERYVGEHNLSSIVEFTGYIDDEDKPSYLASADVVAYPSTGGESFGIVLLEAMAASNGVVLAGDNPGYASVMAPRPDSLFDPYDTSVFADKIVAALTDKDLAKSAVTWQRKYVEQFDVDVVGKQTVEVFKQALHKRRS